VQLHLFLQPSGEGCRLPDLLLEGTVLYTSCIRFGLGSKALEASCVELNLRTQREMASGCVETV